MKMRAWLVVAGSQLVAHYNTLVNIWVVLTISVHGSAWHSLNVQAMQRNESFHGSMMEGILTLPSFPTTALITAFTFSYIIPTYRTITHHVSTSMMPSNILIPILIYIVIYIFSRQIPCNVTTSLINHYFTLFTDLFVGTAILHEAEPSWTLDMLICVLCLNYNPV